MKRVLVLAAALGAAAIAGASQLNVLDNAGKKIGDATFSLTQGSGRVTVKLNMTLAQEGAKVTINTTHAYTAAGDPVSLIMKMSATAQGNSFTSDANVKFEGRKATATMTAMGNTQTKTATAPGAVTDKTVVWMTGKVPAVGATTTAHEFNPMSMTWEKSVATYHGLRDVKTASKTVKAHVLTSKQGNETTKVFFASNGALIKLESSQFNLVQK